MILSKTSTNCTEGLSYFFAVNSPKVNILKQLELYKSIMLQVQLGIKHPVSWTALKDKWGPT